MSRVLSKVYLRRIRRQQQDHITKWKAQGSLSEHAKSLDRLVAEGRIDPLDVLPAFESLVRAAGWQLLSSLQEQTPGFRSSAVRRAMEEEVEGARGIYLSGARLRRARAVTEHAADELKYVMVADFESLARLAEAEIAHGGRERGMVARPLVVGTTVEQVRRLDLVLALSVVRVADRHRRQHAALAKRFPKAHLVTQPLPKAFSKGRTRMGDPEVSAIAADALASIEAAFGRLGFRYFANAGTLLGAVRDQRPVEWDDDVDLLVLGPFDPDVFLRAVSLDRFDLRTQSMALRDADRQRFGIPETSTARRLKIHVSSPGATYPRVTISMAIAHHDPAVQAWSYRAIGRVFDVPDRILGDPRHLPFLGRTIPVPQEAEELLESQYGTDWRIPKVAWGPYEETLESLPKSSRRR